MAGHSQFKNIMHRKGAQDKKRAKVFSRATKEIIVAVKSGGDDREGNPRLRAAIAAARTVNMPKDNIERAIKKAAGSDDATNYEEVRYEGYGPGGVAIIVDALTDNRNRTASDVRSTFTKFGGNLGETNSVAFQFDHAGEITYPIQVTTSDHMLDVALEAGAEDVISTSDDYTVVTSFTNFNPVRESLAAALGDPERAEVLWRPQNTLMVEPDQVETLIKLLNTLEENDDVQQVSSNLEIDDALLESLSA